MILGNLSVFLRLIIHGLRLSVILRRYSEIRLKLILILLVISRFAVMWLSAVFLCYLILPVEVHPYFMNL